MRIVFVWSAVTPYWVLAVFQPQSSRGRWWRKLVFTKEKQEEVEYLVELDPLEVSASNGCKGEAGNFGFLL